MVAAQKNSLLAPPVLSESRWSDEQTAGPGYPHVAANPAHVPAVVAAPTLTHYGCPSDADKTSRYAPSRHKCNKLPEHEPPVMVKLSAGDTDCDNAPVDRTCDT